MKHTKAIIISVLAFFFVVTGVKALTMTTEELRELFGNENLGKQDYEFQRYYSDWVGDRVGTTTTGVAFRITSTGGQSATSTFITRIGYQKNNAVISFMPQAASSSASFFYDILGSNDDYCDTTATSTTDAACVGDCVLASEINWFDMGDFLKDKVHQTSVSTASTTLYRSITNPKVGANSTIILENLAVECLKMNASGSSTVMYVPITTK